MPLGKTEKLEIQQRNLGALAKSPGGFQFIDTFFPYTSGKIGSYYVESTAIENNGMAYRKAIIDMTRQIKSNIAPEILKKSIIAGGETRDWDFSNPVAVFLGIPHLKVYKNGKTKGAHPSTIKDKRIIWVADLNNEGTSPRDYWVPAINDLGGKMEDIYFFVDRLENGVEVMKDLGLKSNAVIPLDKNAWNYLKQEGVVNEEIYGQLTERLKDDNAWAIKMLRSDAGLERLANLIHDPKTRDKGIKILDVGYPEIKEELKSQLSKKHEIGWRN